MKKPLSFLIIFIFIFTLVSMSFSHNAYAYEKLSTDENLNQVLDSISLDDINSYFEKSISELKDQREKSTSDEEKKSIDDNIKVNTNILTTIKTKNFTNKDITKGKDLIRDKLHSTKTTTLYTALSINPVYNVVYTAVVSAIVLGDKLGYTFAAKLLAQSIVAETNSTYNIYDNDSIINSRVKASAFYQNKLSELRNEYRRSGQVNYSKSNFPLSFNGGSTVETDMYYSIHGLNPGGDLSVINGSAVLYLKDLYDFPPLTIPSGFGDLLNDLGKTAINVGVCHVYKVGIYTIENFSAYTPVPYPGYYIQYGSSGYNVTLIQNKLNARNFPCGTADGKFGNMTKSAVISFQKNNGLSADGIVGPATWNKLFNY